MSSQNREKYDSFGSHCEKQFKYTTPHTDICICMELKSVENINPIGAVNFFTKLNCSLYTEECLMTLKIYVKKFHYYEQKIGYIWGLLEQDNFPYIFPKH